MRRIPVPARYAYLLAYRDTAQIWVTIACIVITLYMLVSGGK